MSKQTVNKSRHHQNAFERELSELIVQVDEIREEHPGCGVEKLYMSLLPQTMGRDKFCEIFISLGYRVLKHRNYHRTTTPGKIRYDNYIKGMVVNRPYQVIQSDITYFSIKGRFYYLVFIIDIYTKEIVGYNVSDNLRSSSNVLALKMFLKNCSFKKGDIIHHSDRGSQYTSTEYLELLQDNGIKESMGECAQENSYAERINGIIKNEYLRYFKIDTYRKLRYRVKRIVTNYNHKRKHQTFKKIYTPLEYKEKVLNLREDQRPLVIVHAHQNYKIKKTLCPLDFSIKDSPKRYHCPISLK
nr:IS3 family transposase [Flammeovirga sp. MY04]